MSISCASFPCADHALLCRRRSGDSAAGGGDGGAARYSIILWGKNDDGQLGSGDSGARVLGRGSALEIDVDAEPICGALGLRHTLLALAGAEEGCEVLGVGNSDFGQLGFHSTSRAHRLLSVSFGFGGRFVWPSVDAMGSGGNFTVVLAEGVAYGAGKAEQGQLGSSPPSWLDPEGVHEFRMNPLCGAASVTGRRQAQMVACGALHSALVVEGRFYLQGKCGLYTDDHPVDSVEKDDNGAQHLEFFDDKSVESLSCGRLFTMVIADGKLYGIGDNSQGQLGTGDFESSEGLEPTEIDFFSDPGRRPVAVVCGYESTYVCTNHELYAFGRNVEHQLGLSRADPNFQSRQCPEPSLVDQLDGPVQGITAGREFFLVQTATGSWFGAGRDGGEVLHMARMARREQRAGSDSADGAIGFSSGSLVELDPTFRALFEGSDPAELRTLPSARVIQYTKGAHKRR